MARPRPALDHQVVLKSDADNRAVRVNLLLAAFSRLVRGLPDYLVVSSDIDGEGCIELLVPDCGQYAGGFAPGSVEVHITKLGERDARRAGRRAHR